MVLVKLTITISFWIFIVNGSYPFEYYQCSEFSDLCCPDGHKCTGNTACVKNLTYPTSSSGGAIAGGIVGGIILVTIICCISATIKSKTGKVSRVIYPKRRTIREATVPKKQQPSCSSRPITRQNEMTLPGSYEPFNPPLSHHI
ncbi:uncharacterized protein LOC127737260 isoform X2 [Mytilus californianus]|uniref:uncharacterized protein LOC127737260 isoform X2 n=1 Tax=Mytilus californianus TaxID=6549 RepID=UPI0022477BAF|nr:uncharacterized protein LOC127737260 isoform X2 [Mytilus californianus]